VAAFFANVATVLRPTGVVLLSFPDGRWVVRHGRNAAAAEHEHDKDGGDDDMVRFAVGPARVSIARKHLAVRLPRSSSAPYGLGYTFSFGRHRLVELEEYLVHEGELMRQAAKAGLKHVAGSWRMDEAADMLWRGTRWASNVAAAMGAAEQCETSTAPPLADAYRFIVLARTEEAAAAFQRAMARP
jgi:hypothetical protein